MKPPRPFAALLFSAVLTCGAFAQEAPPVPPPKVPVAASANPWQYNFTVDGYVVPNAQSYVNPTFTANRNWLHLEARYNSENLYTGSLWAGYNFSAGKKLVLDITPMIGGVFGRTTGIAPGCEASLTYKKVELSITNEYVFDTSHSSGSFYYSWVPLTYSPLSWLRVGLVAEHTKAFQTSLSIQRGLLVGFSHKKAEFTTYLFDPGQADPTVVLEVGFSF
ncbi:MAG: hypothetical protein P4M04_07050 [Acidobacteriota bacterium]|nr:hypothetical protein [Acidobacteriota bacterium]